MTAKRPVSRMTASELEALTADLDEEFVMEKFSPLTPAERVLWERAKRKVARPQRSGRRSTGAAGPTR